MDVYSSSIELLEAGVSKHTLSVLVADESGLINRVAGVFARRGANIESLAVGLTRDTALFTIVVTGTDATVRNLLRQIAKLVSVVAVEDVTLCPRVERELMLVKVDAPDSTSALTVRSIADAFRAHVVDASSNQICLAVTGDPGKVAALQRALQRFGILEVVRTGRISLKRGKEVFRDAAVAERAAATRLAESEARGASEADARAAAVLAAETAGAGAPLGSEHASALHLSHSALVAAERKIGLAPEDIARADGPEAEAEAEAVAEIEAAAGETVERFAAAEAADAAAPAPAAEAASPSLDVYSSAGRLPEGALGVWNVRNVLEASKALHGAVDRAGAEGAASLAAAASALPYEPFTVLVEVRDRPGVLNQVTGVVSRRGYNVQSLAVGNSERDGFSRITMVIPGCEADVQKLLKHLAKLPYVDRIVSLNGVPAIVRELMLVKVAARPAQRSELHALATIFHGSVCDLSLETLTIAVVGTEDKMAALLELLQPYGILEIARTGRIATVRPSGIDSKYLESVAGSKVML